MRWTESRGNCIFEITLKCRIIIYLKLEINFLCKNCACTLLSTLDVPVVHFFVTKPFNLVSFSSFLPRFTFAFFNKCALQKYVSKRYKDEKVEIRLWMKNETWKHKKSAFHVEYLLCVFPSFPSFINRTGARVNIKNISLSVLFDK